MQATIMMGVGQGARSAASAGKHDLRLYDKEEQQKLTEKQKIFFNSGKSKWNLTGWGKNRYAEIVKRYKKQIEAENPKPNRRKKLLIKMNKELMDELREEFKELKQKGIVKKNQGWKSKRSTYNVVISFDEEMGNLIREKVKTHEQRKKWAIAVYKATNKVFDELGAQRIYTAFHFDETTPHLHLLFSNLCKDGKALSGKLSLGVSKGRNQITYDQIRKLINASIEKELNKIGWNIHLKPSNIRTSGKKLTVPELRARYVKKLEAELQKKEEKIKELKGIIVAKGSIENNIKEVAYAQQRTVSKDRVPNGG